MRKQIVKDKDISILLKGAIHLEDKDAKILLPEQCAICPEAITGEGTAFKPSGVIPPLTEVPANTVWYTDGSLDNPNVWGWHEDTFESFVSGEEYKHCNAIYIGEEVQSIGGFNSEHVVYIHLPESVNQISTHAFDSNRSLRVIDMPSKVEFIGGGVFAYCQNLKSICVPEGVTALAQGPSGFFEGCSDLEEVMLPETLQSIGFSAFAGCKSLTSIIIPNSVTSIGDHAFEYCSDLTSITIPNSVTTIGEFAFYGCSSLTSIVIPNNVTSIGEEAFRGCSSLTSVAIGNSVTSIGDWAFYYCSSLTSIIIPNSVTYIEYGAFGYCYSLTSITCEAITPPTLGSSNDLSNVQAVYVPAESVEAYKTATNWSYYIDIIQAIP